MNLFTMYKRLKLRQKVNVNRILPILMSDVLIILGLILLGRSLLGCSSVITLSTFFHTDSWISVVQDTVPPFLSKLDVHNEFFTKITLPSFMRTGAIVP